MCIVSSSNMLARITNLSLLCLFPIAVFAGQSEVYFDVDYKTVYFGGKARQAIAVNQQIPAPTLHFKEGDTVTINVTNHLKAETAIHWHGMIIPWQMDGVLGITQHGIQPGQRFRYQFKLRQSGTYWYHAHAGLQEQAGLYGALIIDPLKPTPYSYTKDFPIVLSDWSNTNPDQIYRNLKKEGGYYSPRFPMQASLLRFIQDYSRGDAAERKQLWSDYKSMQTMRMGLYDISDVAFDAFLLNGRNCLQPWQQMVSVGDTVRLRFIGAGATTVFHVKIPDAKMQVVHVEGNDVQAYLVDDLTVAPGETIDVLVKITEDRPYIIYAASTDASGAAMGALLTSPNQAVRWDSVAPFPEPLPVTRDMMANMMPAMNVPSSSQMPVMNHQGHDMAAMNHSGHDMAAMNHKGHDMQEISSHDSMQMSMPTEPTITNDDISLKVKPIANATAMKYEPLKARYPTNDPDKPIAGTITMELQGYMDRYIWFINGVPEHHAKPIVLNPDKRYRIVFINATMMRHPMHLHGHWFILRKGLGAYDPLLHTIDMAPGATTVVDVDTEATGQWLFHCHVLYHMVAGMSRVVQYSSLLDMTPTSKQQPVPEHPPIPYVNRPILLGDTGSYDHALTKHPMAHEIPWNLASFFEVSADPVHQIQKFNYQGLYGGDYNKLQFMLNDAEVRDRQIEAADLDIFYWRVLSQFVVAKGGINYTYRPALRPYWQPGLGLEAMLPYFIETDLRAYWHRNNFKVDLELTRDTQITNNFFIGAEMRGIIASRQVIDDQVGRGLNQLSLSLRPYYRLAPGLQVFVEFERERAYGDYRRMVRAEGDSATDNTVSWGLSVVY